MPQEVQPIDPGRAALLAAVTTLAGSPRILLARGGPGPDPTPLMIMLFPIAFCLWSAATAWGTCAGMVGPLPERRRLFLGVGAAALVAVAAIPFELWFDPKLRAALESFHDPQLLAQSFPATVKECAATMMWGVGLEIAFFQGAALAFFSRLTGRQGLAIGLAVLLRMVVVALKLTMRPGLQDIGMAALLHQLVLSTATCVLYARAGLPAAATLSVLVDARHLGRVLS